MKKKINISIVKGSLNKFGDSSQIIEKLIQNFNDNEEEQFIFHQLNIENILNCKGCKHCFETGTCILDNNDNFYEVKNKLNMSKIIIFSTPIYVDNVSGMIKTFFDRMASWTHLMSLSGKLCILIITTQNSGIKEVSDYLYKVMTSLGLIIVGIILKRTNDDIHFLNDQIETAVFSTMYYLKKPSNISANQTLEKMFQSYKYVYDNCFTKSSKNYEKVQWNNRYKDINTFQDYIDKYIDSS